MEEIELNLTDISEEAVANAGQYCPMLKIFKHNNSDYMAFNQGNADYADNFVMAIAKGMPQLHHLEVIGNAMTNKGLKAILDGCPQLESLDLRRCFYINLDGSFGKLCMERIRNLKLPRDSLEGHKFALDRSEDYRAMYDDMYADYDYDDDPDLEDDEDYEGLSDYDMYSGPYYNPLRDIFDDPNPGELSPFEEYVAVMHAMHAIHMENSSDSENETTDSEKSRD